MSILSKLKLLFKVAPDRALNKVLDNQDLSPEIMENSIEEKQDILKKMRGSFDRMNLDYKAATDAENTLKKKVEAAKKCAQDSKNRKEQEKYLLKLQKHDRRLATTRERKKLLKDNVDKIQRKVEQINKTLEKDKLTLEEMKLQRENNKFNEHMEKTMNNLGMNMEVLETKEDVKIDQMVESMDAAEIAKKYKVTLLK